MRKAFIIALVLAAAAACAALIIGVPWPGSVPDHRPALVEVPPLPAAPRTSVVVAPTAIAISAIRDAMDAAAPRNLNGKKDNPLGALLTNGELGWTVERGPLAAAGRPEGLTLSTTLTGTFRLTGQLGSKASNITGAVGNLLGGSLGRNLQNLTGRALDQRANIRGHVVITSRPAIMPEWRLDPNLSAQVTVADAALSVVGVRVNVPGEVKPFLDRSINEQIAALQTRVRNDPLVEQVARREWTKMCRTVRLGSFSAGLPDLWLEIRPTHAFAAQPRIDASVVTLVLGVQAETRIAAAETTPDCPFPAKLEIVPPLDQGRVSIAVPIDVPFTEVNRLFEAQLKGHTFPEDGSGAVEVTILGAKVAASGDRLLISLRVKAHEKKSFFGFNAEASVHVWGRPKLDQGQQILRLADVALDVESEAAFGLLGAATRVAIPYLQSALAERAVIDLKPFAANARKSIEAVIGDFRRQADGVRVDAAIADLRLAGIEFDAKTLRVIAEATGTANVSVTALPAP